MEAIILSNTVLSFRKPAWNRFAGERGAWVAVSEDGTHEAIAEPSGDDLFCCVVRVDDGEIILEQTVKQPKP